METSQRRSSHIATASAAIYVVPASATSHHYKPRLRKHVGPRVVAPHNDEHSWDFFRTARWASFDDVDDSHRLSVLDQELEANLAAIDKNCVRVNRCFERLSQLHGLRLSNLLGAEINRNGNAKLPSNLSHGNLTTLLNGGYMSVANVYLKHWGWDYIPAIHTTTRSVQNLVNHVCTVLTWLARHKDILILESTVLAPTIVLFIGKVLFVILAGIFLSIRTLICNSWLIHFYVMFPLFPCLGSSTDFVSTATDMFQDIW
jgi:hypothetical protein